MLGSPRLLLIGYLLAVGLLGIFWLPTSPQQLWWWLPLAALGVVGVLDLRSSHNVLRNYPIVGHLRYMMEFLRPELRQYFFESETSGRPFNREQRQIIGARAEGRSDTAPFGTRQDVLRQGRRQIAHAMIPTRVDPQQAWVTIGGPQCHRPYRSSRLNISAMSFGALSGRAITALNLGARRGGFAQDTGEGAISPYHQRHGGDLIWQIASGYFGCRDQAGRFNPEAFSAKAREDQVKMIEIKLSQGAKPGHGGMLPGSKVDQEIAETRQVPVGEDCYSPAAHPEFSTPLELMQFIQRLRDLSGGKPVGIKLCLGHTRDMLAMCKAMLASGIQPDFITVDGAEGGTGAGPAEYADHVGRYIDEALPIVDACLKGIGKRDEISVIASGKVALAIDMVEKFALGADVCNAARPFMFTLGCIQAQRCHTNTCPTGVATQDPARSRSIDVDSKADNVQRFHRATLDACLDMIGTMGLAGPGELRPEHLLEGPATATRVWQVDSLEVGALLDHQKAQQLPACWRNDWHEASPHHFLRGPGGPHQESHHRTAPGPHRDGGEGDRHHPPKEVQR